MSRFFSKPAAEKVVSLERFRSGKSLSPIRQAEAYWAALRDGFGVPRRSQINPRGLENILEYAFIVERIAPGIARFRLAGHHLSDLAGMEVRGMPMTAFFTPSARGRIGAVLEHMFDAPAVAELTLTSEAKRCHPMVDARMILLPLENDHGEVTRALGVLIADGPLPQNGLRFDLDATILRPVAGTAQRPASQLVTGFAEAQEPLGQSVPHLRLVE